MPRNSVIGIAVLPAAARTMDMILGTPAEFLAPLKSGIRKWVKVVREAGIPQQ